MMETIKIQGWKGKSSREIIQTKDSYKIIEYRKHKETGEINEQITFVPKNNVEVLRNIISTGCDYGETYGYRWIVSKLKLFYKFEVDTEAWNGGKNRSRYYFPYHYYPLKILEAQGLIRYSCGRIMRLQ